MNNQLLIPDKIRVGYQKRTDTYTQRLAYIIYYDKKGVLRKETSFEGWRHKDLPVDEYENKPHSGFVLNKDVKRSSEWFGNGRNMVRVYDDRGIEFEITTGNLMFILMTTDCLRRGLEGEFVYAWSGTELVLLPTGCDEYKNSVDYSNLQTGKVAAKTLMPGASYKTKRQEDYIYIGRYDWFYLDYAKRDHNQSGVNYKCVESKKMQIFYDPKTEKFIPLNSMNTLASVSSDIPVSNFAELMDKFNATPYASKIIGIESRPIENLDVIDGYYGDQIHNNFYTKIDDNTYQKYELGIDHGYNRETNKYEIRRGYYFHNTYERKFQVIHENLAGVDKMYFVESYRDLYRNNGTYNFFEQKRPDPVYMPKEDILKSGEYVELYVVQENGNKFLYHKLYN